MKPSLVTIISALVLVSMMHLVVAQEMGEIDRVENTEPTAPATLSPDDRAEPEEPPPIHLDPVEEELEETAGSDDVPDPGALPKDLYLIQPGDVLSINVWREPDLEGEAIVLPDGTFSFPLIGYMKATGETLPTVQENVTARLTKYIADPVVTVSLIQLSGNQIYVIGNVARPGAFTANRNLDVMQLLSLAGGMTNFAAVNKVKILRREDGVQKVINFRYRDIEKGRNLEQNIILQGGDVVVVP